jgi:hypothetical protein
MEHFLEHLQTIYLELASAHRTAPFKPEIKVYAHGEGIFDPSHQKLKNDYVWNIDYKRALKEGIVGA